jgi:hypothetical protein
MKIDLNTLDDEIFFCEECGEPIFWNQGDKVSLICVICFLMLVKVEGTA